MFKLRIINNGILDSLNAMPIKDKTSDNENNFALNRVQHVRTISSVPVLPEKRWYTNTNRDSSSVINSKKAHAIGATSMNPNSKPMSFTNNTTDIITNQALNRVRNKGYTVPLKKTQQYLN
jgi:hypothetical protein